MLLEHQDIIIITLKAGSCLAVLVMTLASRIVHSDPDILGGTPVFVGTRVPMKNLLDYLEAGDSLEVFLDHFPSVNREQAIAFKLSIICSSTFCQSPCW